MTPTKVASTGLFPIVWFLSKTLERIFASQIDEYLHDNGHNAKMQLASRKYHSPETALILSALSLKRICWDLNGVGVVKEG